MKGLMDFTAATSRHALRVVVIIISLVAGGCLVLALGFTLYAVNLFPDLEPWHTSILDEEFSAFRDQSLDFAGYQALEARLFDSAAAIAESWAGSGELYEYSRFNAAAPVALLAPGAPYNRSFRLTPAKPAGGALLVHGLSDSPYSMKALAEVLLRRGFEVTVLRLPGHGTFPSMMTGMHYRDWQAAVRLAARDVAARTPAGQPFFMGGYSTGATLVMSYALDSTVDQALRKPDRVLLISPAVELARIAVLTNIIDVTSVVPLPVLQKVRWQTITAEYDPYKFNSIPVNALRQVNHATSKLQAAIGKAATENRLEQLPPVVTWQSVADATVGASGVVTRLYTQLRGGKHRLVIFDVNRHGALQSVQRPAARVVIEQALGSHQGYTLEVVSNISGDSREVALHRYPPGESEPEVEPLGLDWPADVVSLSHVALPFPPDDPVYGFLPGSGRNGRPSIGSLLLRGESTAVTVSLAAFTRLRSNPFWSLIEQQVAQLVDEDMAKGK